MVDEEVFLAFLGSIDRLVVERLIPAEQVVEETDEIPADIIRAIRDLGLFGLSLPQDFGGLGLSVVQEVRVVEKMNRSSQAFGTRIAINNGIGSLGILSDGTEEQRSRWLPRIASGEIVCAFALTEPNVGSDAAALTTRAERVSDGYRLNGTKRFITNGPEAGLFTVIAKVPPEPGRLGGMTAFLVERGCPGLQFGPRDRKMGQRGSHSCDVILDDCFVPSDAVLGAQEGRGIQIALRVLDRGRLHLAAGCIGMMQRLIEEAISYALDRKTFGKPIGEHQLIQAMLADMFADTLAARSMVHATAAQVDKGCDAANEVAACKLFATEAAGRIADSALQIFGGAGYMVGTTVERLYRDVRLLRIYEGTSEMQRINIAKGMLRAAAFARIK